MVKILYQDVEKEIFDKKLEQTLEIIKLMQEKGKWFIDNKNIIVRVENDGKIQEFSYKMISSKISQINETALPRENAKNNKKDYITFLDAFYSAERARNFFQAMYERGRRLTLTNITTDELSKRSFRSIRGEEATRFFNDHHINSQHIRELGSKLCRYKGGDDSFIDEYNSLISVITGYKIQSGNLKKVLPSFYAENVPKMDGKQNITDTEYGIRFLEMVRKLGVMDEKRFNKKDVKFRDEFRKYRYTRKVILIKVNTPAVAFGVFTYLHYYSHTDASGSVSTKIPEIKYVVIGGSEKDLSGQLYALSNIQDANEFRYVLLPEFALSKDQTILKSILKKQISDKGQNNKAGPIIVITTRPSSFKEGLDSTDKYIKIEIEEDDYENIAEVVSDYRNALGILPKFYLYASQNIGDGKSYNIQKEMPMAEQIYISENDEELPKLDSPNIHLILSPGLFQNNTRILSKLFWLSIRGYDVNNISFGTNSSTIYVEIPSLPNSILESYNFPIMVPKENYKIVQKSETADAIRNQKILNYCKLLFKEEITTYPDLLKAALDVFGIKNEGKKVNIINEEAIEDLRVISFIEKELEAFLTLFDTSFGNNDELKAWFFLMELRSLLNSFNIVRHQKSIFFLTVKDLFFHDEIKANSKDKKQKRGDETKYIVYTYGEQKWNLGNLNICYENNQKEISEKQIGNYIENTLKASQIIKFVEVVDNYKIPNNTRQILDVFFHNKSEGKSDDFHTSFEEYASDIIKFTLKHNENNEDKDEAIISKIFETTLTPAFFLRFITMIHSIFFHRPYIMEGSTGSGKTYLAKLFNKFMKLTEIINKEEGINTILPKPKKIYCDASTKFENDEIKDDEWILYEYDEMNTTDFLNELSYWMLSKSSPNKSYIATINEYVELTTSQHELTRIGIPQTRNVTEPDVMLLAKLDEKSNIEKKRDAAKYAYNVHPLPNIMKNYCYPSNIHPFNSKTFDELDENYLFADYEKVAIRSIIFFFLSADSSFLKAPKGKKFKKTDKNKITNYCKGSILFLTELVSVAFKIRRNIAGHKHIMSYRDIIYFLSIFIHLFKKDLVISKDYKIEEFLKRQAEQFMSALIPAYSVVFIYSDMEKRTIKYNKEDDYYKHAIDFITGSKPELNKEYPLQVREKLFKDMMECFKNFGGILEKHKLYFVESNSDEFDIHMFEKRFLSKSELAEELMEMDFRTKWEEYHKQQAESTAKKFYDNENYKVSDIEPNDNINIMLYHSSLAIDVFLKNEGISSPSVILAGIPRCGKSLTVSLLQYYYYIRHEKAKDILFSKYLCAESSNETSIKSQLNDLAMFIDSDKNKFGIILFEEIANANSSLERPLKVLNHDSEKGIPFKSIKENKVKYAKFFYIATSNNDIDFSLNARSIRVAIHTDSRGDESEVDNTFEEQKGKIDEKQPVFSLLQELFEQSPKATGPYWINKNIYSFYSNIAHFIMDENKGGIKIYMFNDNDFKLNRIETGYNLLDRLQDIIKSHTRENPAIIIIDKLSNLIVGSLLDMTNTRKPGDKGKEMPEHPFEILYSGGCVAHNPGKQYSAYFIFVDEEENNDNTSAIRARCEKIEYKKDIKKVNIKTDVEKFKEILVEENMNIETIKDDEKSIKAFKEKLIKINWDEQFRSLEEIVEENMFKDETHAVIVFTNSHPQYTYSFKDQRKNHFYYDMITQESELISSIDSLKDKNLPIYITLTEYDPFELLKIVRIVHEYTQLPPFLVYHNISKEKLKEIIAFDDIPMYWADDVTIKSNDHDYTTFEQLKKELIVDQELTAVDEKILRVEKGKIIENISILAPSDRVFNNYLDLIQDNDEINGFIKGLSDEYKTNDDNEEKKKKQFKLISNFKENVKEHSKEGKEYFTLVQCFLEISKMNKFMTQHAKYAIAVYLCAKVHVQNATNLPKIKDIYDYIKKYFSEEEVADDSIDAIYRKIAIEHTSAILEDRLYEKYLAERKLGAIDEFKDAYNELFKLYNCNTYEYMIDKFNFENAEILNKVIESFVGSKSATEDIVRPMDLRGYFYKTNNPSDLSNGDKITIRQKAMFIKNNAKIDKISHSLISLRNDIDLDGAIVNFTNGGLKPIEMKEFIKTLFYCDIFFTKENVFSKKVPNFLEGNDYSELDVESEVYNYIAHLMFLDGSGFTDEEIKEKKYLKISKYDEDKKNKIVNEIKSCIDSKELPEVTQGNINQVNSKISNYNAKELTVPDGLKDKPIIEVLASELIKPTLGFKDKDITTPILDYFFNPNHSVLEVQFNRIINRINTNKDSREDFILLGRLLTPYFNTEEALAEKLGKYFFYKVLENASMDNMHNQIQNEMSNVLKFLSERYILPCRLKTAEKYEYIKIDYHTNTFISELYKLILVGEENSKLRMLRKIPALRYLLPSLKPIFNLGMEVKRMFRDQLDLAYVVLKSFEFTRKPPEDLQCTDEFETAWTKAFDSLNNCKIVTSNTKLMSLDTYTLLSAITRFTIRALEVTFNNDNYKVNYSPFTFYYLLPKLDEYQFGERYTPQFVNMFNTVMFPKPKPNEHGFDFNETIPGRITSLLEESEGEYALFSQQEGYFKPFIPVIPDGAKYYDFMDLDEEMLKQSLRDNLEKYKMHERFNLDSLNDDVPGYPFSVAYPALYFIFDSTKSSFVKGKLLPYMCGLLDTDDNDNSSKGQQDSIKVEFPSEFKEQQEGIKKFIDEIKKTR